MRSTLTCLLAVALFACGKLADESSGREDNGGLIPGGETPGTAPTSSISSSSGSTVTPKADDEVNVASPKRTDLALQTLAALKCQGVSDCGLSGPHIFVGTWGDQASCVAKWSDDLATNLAKRGITITQAQVDACAARLALTPCVYGIPECEFTGDLATGDQCTDDAQCQSGRCTFPNGDPTKYCGACTARAAAGEACSYDYQCAIGLACNAVTKKCMSPLPASASCVAAEEMCGPGLTCLNGVCTERLPIGSACTWRGRIKYGYYDDCAAGSWCASETLLCTPFKKLEKTAGIGESCSLDVPCRASRCSDDTHLCEPWGAHGTNTPPPPVCR